MEYLSVLLIAVGLAMDAFAVAICKGLAMRKPGVKAILVIGLWFGFFQAVMPVIGYLLGSSFYSYISEYDRRALGCPLRKGAASRILIRMGMAHPDSGRKRGGAEAACGTASDGGCGLPFGCCGG